MRSAQAELAREHGVYGFCYYFYWFGGRRLLERPLELMLEDGQPDLPFALCWANEPWTRRWDGREQDVLMPQHHDRVRDLAILDDLMPYFEDPRYIRIDGRPLLLIYRQGLMPDAPGFAADLRAEAVRRGLPGLFLCNVLSIGDIERCAPGFDAAVEFPPHGTIGKEIRARDLGADRAFRGHIYDYASTVLSAVARPIAVVPLLPGRDAPLGQHRPQGAAGAHLPWVDARALRALAATSEPGHAPTRTRARRSSSSTRGTSGRRARIWSRTSESAGATSRSFGESSGARTRATSDVARLRSIRQTRTLRSEGRSSKSHCGPDGLMRPWAVPPPMVWPRSSQPTADRC